MTLYDRYIDGQFEEVYSEIEALGQDAFLPENLPEVEKVLTETFERTAYNLDIIYTELKNLNYLFKTNPVYNFERPLHPPLPDTTLLLERLDAAVKRFGYVPLSLKYFYKIVGGVNFTWDYQTNENLLWNLADPIQIDSLDAVVGTVAQDWWQD